VTFAVESDAGERGGGHGTAGAGMKKKATPRIR
jgi:hypothetical protein